MRVYTTAEEAGALLCLFLGTSLLCASAFLKCSPHFRPELTQNQTVSGPVLADNVSLSASGAWLDLYYKIQPPLGFVSTL